MTQTDGPVSGAREAGRELDVEVLVQVFGFPRRKVFANEWSGEPCYIPSGKPRRTHMIDARPVPDHSTDIAAAWQVVEKLRAAGHWMSLTSPDEDGDTPWEQAWCAHIELADGTARMGWADTAPLAICKAALAALTQEVPNG